MLYHRTVFNRFEVSYSKFHRVVISYLISFLNPWTVSYLEPIFHNPLASKVQMKKKRRNNEPKPLLLRSLVTAVTDSPDGSSGVGSLVTTRVLKVVFSDD